MTYIILSSKPDQILCPGTDQEAMVVTGRVSWIADDNKRYTLDFTADRNGYRPMYTIA